MPNRHVYVRCPSCGWTSQRTAHDPRDLNVDVGGYGACIKCGTRMQRILVSVDRRAKKAQAEIVAMDEEGRVE